MILRSTCALAILFSLASAEAVSQPAFSVGAARSYVAKLVGAQLLPDSAPYSIPQADRIGSASNQLLRMSTRDNAIAREAGLFSLEASNNVVARALGKFMEMQDGLAGVCGTLSDFECEKGLSDAQKFRLMELEAQRDLEAMSCRPGYHCQSTVYPVHTQAVFATSGITPLRPINFTSLTPPPSQPVTPTPAAQQQRYENARAARLEASRNETRDLLRRAEEATRETAEERLDRQMAEDRRREQAEAMQRQAEAYRAQQEAAWATMQSMSSSSAGSSSGSTKSKSSSNKECRRSAHTSGRGTPAIDGPCQ